MGVIVGGPDNLRDDAKFSSFLTGLGHESQHALGQAAVIICRTTVKLASYDK